MFFRLSSIYTVQVVREILEESQVIGARTNDLEWFQVQLSSLFAGCGDGR